MQRADELSGARRPPSERFERRKLPRWLVAAGETSWRLLALGAVVYFTFEALGMLRLLIIPLLLGLFVAALLEPLASRFERVLPAGLAAFAAILMALAMLGGALAFLGTRTVQQFDQVRGFIDRGWNQLVELVHWGPLDMSEKSLIASLIKQLQTQAGNLASSVAAGASTLFVISSEILLTLAFAFFMMRDGRRLFDGLVERIGSRYRDGARKTAMGAWKTLGRYLRGLSLLALANSLEKGLALVVIGIPMVIPIMILTFIGSFIPFAGPIVAGAVAALVALAHSGINDALLIIAAAFLIQIIEGNVLQPFILGKTMRLEPILILAAVAAGAIVGGLAGAFFAVPVLAAARSAIGAARAQDSAD